MRQTDVGQDGGEGLQAERRASPEELVQEGAWYLPGTAGMPMNLEQGEPGGRDREKSLWARHGRGIFTVLRNWAFLVHERLSHGRILNGEIP
jgi:hypothetical protein